MNTYTSYLELVKPIWAPPSWVFGPVWTILYIIIGVSFGYVAYKYFERKISFLILLPFILNLIFNFAFTPLQFGLKDLTLASIDVLLTLITLIWALITVFPKFAWVTYINIPYLLWTSFATVLQLTITFLNRG